MLLNVERTISVFTYEINFMQKATESLMTLVTCSKLQEGYKQPHFPHHILSTYISTKVGFL